MKNLRVIDEAGNKQDFEAEFVPRIGELLVWTYQRGGEQLKEHYFRVRDVMYKLDNPPDSQAAILIAEEDNPEPWA